MTGTASAEIPYFRFHPDPLSTGVIEERSTRCPVCDLERPLVYVGPFYSVEELEGICPWCIADGTAAARHDGTFQDDFGLSDIDAASLDELIHRTPGYSSWQQEVWRTHCGQPCAYLGRTGTRRIRELGVELEADLIEEGIADELDSLYEEAPTGPNLMDVELHLFRCLHCGRHRLAVNVS